MSLPRSLQEMGIGFVHGCWMHSGCDRDFGWDRAQLPADGWDSHAAISSWWLPEPRCATAAWGHRAEPPQIAAHADPVSGLKMRGSEAHSPRLPVVFQACVKLGGSPASGC